MGMFDSISIHVSDLPKDTKISQYTTSDIINCQTKDIENTMSSFRIENNKLWKKFREVIYDPITDTDYTKDTFWLEYPYHDTLEFYSIGRGNDYDDLYKFIYCAHFNRGIMTKIDILEETKNGEKL